MARDAINPAIFKEVAQALDPDGKMRAWRDGSAALARFLPHMKEAQDLRFKSAEMDALLETAALANQIFSPRGWGVTNIPVPDLERAIDVSTTNIEEADNILADAWLPGKVDRSIMRMKYIYARMEPGGVSDRRRERWNLLREAKDLHFDGCYRASVPLMLANIEGFVADAVAGKLFFTVRDSLKIGMENPARLSGMVCAMTTLHAVYTRGVGETTTESVLSRHGIMHGRVLGYGTKVVSAQTFTLFDAVVDLLI